MFSWVISPGKIWRFLMTRPPYFSPPKFVVVSLFKLFKSFHSYILIIWICCDRYSCFSPLTDIVGPPYNYTRFLGWTNLVLNSAYKRGGKFGCTIWPKRYIYCINSILGGWYSAHILWKNWKYTTIYIHICCPTHYYCNLCLFTAQFSICVLWVWFTYIWI